MRTFTIYFVTIIVLLAMVQPVCADGVLSLSGGVSLTQSTNTTSMGSRVDAWCGAKIVASWVSTSSKLLKMPEGLVYVAYSDFTGIRNIESVYLTPDDGITKWPAKKLVGKGWQVKIPYEWVLACGSSGGSYGAYGLKWIVNSKDERNRLFILFIPLTWNGHRGSESLNQVIFEESPYGHETFCEEDWALYLSLHCGFESVIALPDLNFEAQRQALNGFRATHPEQPTEQPAERPKVRERPDRDRPSDDRSEPTPPRKKVEEMDPPTTVPNSFDEREPDQSAQPRVEVPRRAVTYSAEKIILRTSSAKPTTIKVHLDNVRGKNMVIFQRSSKSKPLGTAQITGYINDVVYATLMSGNVKSLSRGDSVELQTWRVN